MKLRIAGVLCTSWVVMRLASGDRLIQFWALAQVVMDCAAFATTMVGHVEAL